jgi:hypothetical protein
MLHQDLVSRDEQLAVFAAKGATITVMLLHQAIQGGFTTGPLHSFDVAFSNAMTENLIEEEHVRNQVHCMEHCRSFFAPFLCSEESLPPCPLMLIHVALSSKFAKMREMFHGWFMYVN